MLDSLVDCLYQLKASLNISLVGFDVLHILDQRDICLALYNFRKFLLVKELRELVEYAFIVDHILCESLLNRLINLFRHVVFKVFNALLHHLHRGLLLDHGGTDLVREAIPERLLYIVLVDLILQLGQHGLGCFVADYLIETPDHLSHLSVLVCELC